MFEKYALAERSRHPLLLATRDVEGTKRKVHTLEKIHFYLENTDESESKIWLRYTDRELSGL